jgi:hypothetical protein
MSMELLPRSPESRSMAGSDRDARSVADLAAASGLAVDPESIRFNETGLSRFSE